MDRKIHFALLVIGTVFYLLRYPGLLLINNGVGEIDAVDFATFCSSTMFYTAFVVCVFGHALLWSSSTKHRGHSDDVN
jgi:hypothetical protein